MAAIKRLIRGERVDENASGKTATISDLIQIIGGPGENNICTAHDDPAGFAYGAPHPCVPNIVVIAKTTRPVENENETFIQETTFGRPDDELTAGGRFSMAGSLSAADTTRDRDGNQVVLTYTYPAAPAYKDFTLAGQTRNQIPELDVNKPTLLYRWTRLRDTYAQASAHLAILGKVNSAAIWNVAAELLLCTRMEIDQSGTKWRETFEFQYTGESWTSYAIFKQEDDNRPVSGPDALAEKNVPVYATYNYSLTGLLLPA